MEDDFTKDASEDVLKLFPDLKIVQENQEVFNFLANYLLLNPLPDKNVYAPENYFPSLGHILGFFSELIGELEKNGWKKS